MPVLKIKEIGKMSRQEREGKLKELKMELIKSKANPSKKGSSRKKEIKKTIARIMTLNTKENLGELNKK